MYPQTILDTIIMRFRYSQALKAIKACEKKNKGRTLKILDVGGAEGNFHELLCKRGHQVTVMDINTSADIIHNLENPFPIEDKTYDVAVSLAVVEHLNNTEQFLKELQRVADAVILTTPAPISKPILNLLAKYNLVNRSHIEDHKKYITEDELTEAGYEHSYFSLFFNQIALYNIDIRIHLAELLLVPFMLCFYLAVIHVYPQDDYWRHLVSHKYNFDYTQLYIYSYLPTYNPWIGYEYLLKYLHIFTGELSFVVVQCLTVILFSIGYLIATKDGKAHNAKIVFMILMFYLLSGRIATARPSVLFAALFFVLWFLENRHVRVIIPAITAPFYWLFFIYSIPLMIKERLVIIPTALGFLFWTLYSDGWYFSSMIALLNAVQSSGDALLVVKETRPILTVLISAFPFGLIPILMCYKKDIKTVIASLFFALSNQVRYMDVITPLTVSFVRFFKKDIPRLIMYCAFPLLFIGFHNVGNLKNVDLSMLQNKRVWIMDFSWHTFEIAYRAYPIKMAPSMEVRWSEQPILDRMTDAFLKGKFECSILNQYNFDYVIESSLREIPECFQLEKIIKTIRIWKVKKELS